MYSRPVVSRVLSASMRSSSDGSLFLVTCNGLSTVGHRHCVDRDKNLLPLQKIGVPCCSRHDSC